MVEWTSITISRDTHTRLDQMGQRGESYNDIVRRLIGWPKETSRHPGRQKKTEPTAAQVAEEIAYLDSQWEKEDKE